MRIKVLLTGWFSSLCKIDLPIKHTLFELQVDHMSLSQFWEKSIQDG
jgi:hypothetical protein